MSTATKTRTRTGKAQKNLQARRVSAREYNVESDSETLGYHTVRQVHTGDWTCGCKGFKYRLTCAHVDAVEIAERKRLAVPVVHGDTCRCHSHIGLATPRTVEAAKPKNTLQSLFSDN